ncbi:Serine/threonine protein kinase [Thermomonospora echinospora]|uniref:Serine/threonine protein kinase n=1 Tax=Thermomonospora echinospora TaxID=1992 RepID=A0A1H6A271_9ACTN|nr:serine/threonine-protein kinase [Thermomonospora echinospora]SEG42863.1 Serine/threonine protein kinase [Thermomonospora echinospora]
MQPPAQPNNVFDPLAPEDPPHLGGYRILARIGAGGMGRVYLGATQSGRRLAIKVVRPEFADDPEFRRRFRQEVTAAQRVQSLYTAAVIDAELDGPRPWMATVYVPGPSLAQVVAEQGPLAPETVRPLAAGVAEALVAIHRAGVIHRDLKPSNVLLAPDGPQVIDFGIARAADATPLTRTGVRIGTPHFMAPEQALGRHCTPAVDVFSLGVLVFFAATGRSPFGEGPDQAVLFRIAREEPNLDGCPDDLHPLIERCLAKEPDARPALRELMDELNPGGDAPPPGWLPPEVTRRLDSYSAEPPPPAVPPRPGPPGPPASPVRPGTPPATAPPPGALARTAPGPQPYAGPPVAVPGAPGSRSTTSRTLAIALGGVGAVALLLLVTVIVLLADGPAEPTAPQGRDERSAAAPAPDPAGPPTSSGPLPSASDAPAGGTPPGTLLKEYEGIQLATDYTIDFLGDPKHPREGDDGDLSYSAYRSDEIRADRLAVLDPGQPDTYQACRDNTRYTEYLDDDGYKRGTRFCVYTDQGLTVLVKVTDLQSDPSDFVTLDLKIWQGFPAPSPTG